MAIEHVERTRVAWVDTDAGGRIHFTAAFRWAEMAEVALRRRLGLVEGWGDYPRRKVEAEFLKVLRFEDEIEVRIRVERLGTSSITWAFEITRDDDLCVRGSIVVVHVDVDGVPSPLTKKERAVARRLTLSRSSTSSSASRRWPSARLISPEQTFAFRSFSTASTWSARGRRSGQRFFGSFGAPPSSSEMKWSSW